MNHGKFPKQEDSYAFEEDSSSESLSPEQHHSDESQGSACPLSEAVGSTPSSSSSPALTSPRQVKTWVRLEELFRLLWLFCPPVLAEQTAALASFFYRPLDWVRCHIPACWAILPAQLPLFPHCLPLTHDDLIPTVVTSNGHLIEIRARTGLFTSVRLEPLKPINWIIDSNCVVSLGNVCLELFEIFL